MGDREVVLQLKLSRRLVAVAAMIVALALGVVAVGTVFAQSTTTTINGCVTNKTGALRIVSAPSTCKSGETAISWNQQGPQGLQGVPGEPGQPGTNGADGANGIDGQDGKTILNGNGAPAADLGRAGDYYIDNQADDIYGPKTANGWGQPTSLIGPQGEPGADGLDGTNGTNGTDGQDGKTILNGSGAPAAGLGTDGDFYIDTSANDIYGPKSANG